MILAHLCLFLHLSYNEVIKVIKLSRILIVLYNLIKHMVRLLFLKQGLACAMLSVV